MIVFAIILFYLDKSLGLSNYDIRGEGGAYVANILLLLKETIVIGTVVSNDIRGEWRTSKRCFDFLSGMSVGVSSEETQGELKQMLRIKYLNFCC